ncbi:hypothetical protein [Hyalangium gracile]|uniref:hypothetical protein n=1 Tax=Hyalangium gracile TaxID=394092 RepID=UPI001CCA2464|nr:hypothetical protein [Hyalangium gracile]
MTSRQIRLGPVQLKVPQDWADITDELEGDDKPYTVADPQEGVGALQLSTGLFQGGVVPHPSESDLRAMVLRFGEERGLGDALDETRFTKNSLMGAGMSFHEGEDLIRVWCVSDGKNFALVTYTCAWADREREAALCEEIVESLQFQSPS